jgi:hypothetical protein
VPAPHRSAWDRLDSQLQLLQPMSVQSNLKLAAYFERRAKMERRDKLERERLLAVAREYREWAKAEQKDKSGQDFQRSSRAVAQRLIGLGFLACLTLYLAHAQAFPA